MRRDAENGGMAEVPGPVATIGELLRGRVERGERTREEARSELKVSQATYSRYENDLAVPPPEAWESLMRYLKLGRRQFGEHLLATGERVSERRGGRRR